MGVWVLQNKELPDTETCQALLDRILSSPQLRRSNRMRDLLAYVGRRALQDGCEQLREQEIGTEVFGRPEGYDTSTDNIVRVNATELRKRIEAYFESEGHDEALLMEIPRGSYIPVFRFRPVESPVEAGQPLPAPLQEPQPSEAAPEALVEAPAEAPVKKSGQSGWWLAGGIAAGLVIAALVGVCLHLWLQNRAMHKLLYPWESKPAVAALWSGFLQSNRTTDVVMADSGFGILQRVTKDSFSLQNYLNRSYLDQLQGEDLNPSVRSLLELLAQRTLVSRGGFTMAQHLESLAPLSNRIHIYFARNYMPSLIKRDNVVLFGNQMSNPWMAIYESKLNFVVTPNPNPGNTDAANVPQMIVTNRAPAAGEKAVYAPSGNAGYCTAAYLPNAEHTGKVILIEGTTSEAAQGCGDFLLSEAGMSNLRTKLGAGKLPYFQVLLRTSQLIDTPMTSSIVAYRSFPKLR